MSSNPPQPQPPMSFEELVEHTLNVIANAVRGDWQTISALNELGDPVFLKNADGVLVHVNDAFTRFYSPHVSPVGRNGAAFLESSIVSVSQHSDELIGDGTKSVEFEHVGRGPDGRAYLIRSYKESLSELGNPGLALVGVSRILGVAPDSGALPKLDIADKHRRFRAFEETDREIARQIGLGMKVREIAEGLELTTRTVEQRKRKILSALELDQTVDLVKLLVRMQDRGFIDLGL